MIKFYRVLSLVVLLLLYGVKLNAQCVSPFLYGSSTCNGPGPATITTCNYAGEYSDLTLNFAGTYTFASDNPTDYLTLFEAGNPVPLAFGITPIMFTITQTGSYELHVASSGPPSCGQDANCRMTSYTVAGLPGSPSILSGPGNKTECVGGNVQFSVIATPTNVTYQWEEDAGFGFAPVVNGGVYAGATTSVLSLSGITGGMNGYFYQCIVTNTVSSITSTAGILTVLNSGSLPLLETFNANLNMPPLWANDFFNPWYVDNNHGTGGTNGMTNNLYTYDTLASVELVKVGPATPSTAISFDYRIVDYSNYPNNATPLNDVANDSLNVYVSVNCGSTYSLLGSFNASNHTVTTNFYNASFPLAAYAGSSLVIKFVAKHDPNGGGDYYVDIDNINIFNLMSNDAGVNNFVTPVAGQPCYSNAEPVTVVVRNFGNNNISNFPVTTIVSGAVSQTLTSIFTGTLAPGANANFTTGTLNMLSAGTYSFKSYASYPGDPVAGNDTLFPLVTRTVTATMPVPYSQNFNANLNMPLNWVPDLNEGFYVMSNHGTAGSNGMTYNLYGPYNNALTDMPRIGALTPSSSISFDYRLVNYSGYPSTATPTVDLVGDSLKLMISTDCGLTFNTVGLITVANHTATTQFTNKSYTVGGYAGNDAIFKFHAVRSATNSSDYYVDIDNVNIYNLTATDAGIAALLTPTAGGCYTTSEPVNVTIENFGTGPISNIPVNVYISGPLNQTISATYTGSLSVGGTTNFLVGNANMGFGGVYTFSSTTSLPGDGNSINDFNVTTRTVQPMVNIAGPSIVCIGNSATLTAGGADTYTWSNGSNSTTIAVSPSVTTTYSVNGTDLSGCTAAFITTVSVQNPTITANGASACGNPANGTLTALSFSPSTVNWYASPTSTVVLGTGTNFAVSSPTNVTYYAEANSTTNDSLFTTLAGGNGFSGNMFDITTNNAITIDGVKMHFDSPGTTTVEVWYRPGTFVGFENSNVGWTLATTTTVNALGPNVLTPVTNMTINIPPGSTYGLYVTSNGGAGVNYTDGTGLGNLYASNPDLQLFEGKGGGYFNVINSPRIFNGTLKYTKQGCNTPRVPATFTVTPNLNVTAAGNNTAVCSGAVVTLTAGGAQSYTWSPAINLTPSPNAGTVQATPTVNTTYTVIGDAPGCPPATAYFSVSINPAPILTISPSPSVYVLPGSFVTLSAQGANSYSWEPGGSNNNNILVNPGVTTTYTVTGTNSFGCKTSSMITVFMSEVGVKEVNGEDMSLQAYPNPNNGIITVSTAKTSLNYTFEVFDLTGKMVFSESVSKTETQIDIRELANGLYTYKIKNADTGTTLRMGKMVKQ